jgi:O-antigen ligase
LRSSSVAIGDPLPRVGTAGPKESSIDNWPRTTRVLPWLIASFIVLIWLVPFPQAQLPFQLPVDAHYDRAFVLLLGVVWLLCVAAGGKHAPRFRSNPMHAAVIIFVAVAIASVALNANELDRVGELTLGLKKLSLLFSLVAFYLIVTTVIRPSEVRAFTVFIVIVASIAAAGTIYEYRTHTNLFYDVAQSVLPGVVTHPEQFDALDEIGRPSIVGPTQHGLAIASILAMALPFAVIGLLDARNRARKFLWALAVALIFAGALSTLRKTSGVAPLGTLVVLALYRPRSLLRLLPLAAVLVGVVHVLSPGALGSVQSQLTNAGQVNSTKDRKHDYQAVTPDVAHHPFFGRGYKTYEPPVHRYLDNEYLGTLVETGVLGILSLLAMGFTGMVVAHRVLKRGDPERGPPMLGVIAAMATFLIVNALFDATSFLEVPYVFFLLAALAVVCSRPHAPAPSRTLVRVPAQPGSALSVERHGVR